MNLLCYCFLLKESIYVYEGEVVSFKKISLTLLNTLSIFPNVFGDYVSFFIILNRFTLSFPIYKVSFPPHLPTLVMEERNSMPILLNQGLVII